MSISTYIEGSIKVKSNLLIDSNFQQIIKKLISAGVRSIKNNGKLIFAGNGGSFSDSLHISGEFSSRFLLDRTSLPSIVLGSNIAYLTATANDFSYDDIFARELSSIGNSQDVLIAFSTSGKSQNIHKLLNQSKIMNIESFCLTGKNDNLDNYISNLIKVPSNFTPYIQESHIMIGHIICKEIEIELSKQ